MFVFYGRSERHVSILVEEQVTIALSALETLNRWNMQGAIFGHVSCLVVFAQVSWCVRSLDAKS